MDEDALTIEERQTLEALADTMVPGRKRFPGDVAIAGVHDTPGAVEAGALAVLTDPATGIDDGVAGMAHLLNERAHEYLASRSPIAAEDAASESDDPSSGGASLAPFVALTYEDRRALYAELTHPGNPEREIWFILGLFAYMAFDSAPHMDTAKAMGASHPGLLQLGFSRPDSDGLWRNPEHTYGRQLSRVHLATDKNGDIT